MVAFIVIKNYSLKQQYLIIYCNMIGVQSVLTRNLHKRQQSQFTIPDERSPVPPTTHPTKQKCSAHKNHDTLQGIRNIVPSNKLTFGLKNYEEIKNVYTVSKGMDKNKEPSTSYRFTPQINGDGSGCRNFNDFIDGQNQFEQKKLSNIKKLKTEMNEISNCQNTRTPKIDKKSRKISEGLNQDEVFSRLSKERHHHDVVLTDETLFTPKILHKSKKLRRKDKVQNLLYDDAKRRQQHNKMTKSAHHLLPSNLPPKNRNTNRLVFNKINQQLNQLLEGQEQISPIVAISVISQLFKVDLNPNKDQQTEGLCHQVLVYLIDDTYHGCHDSFIKKTKIQHFIKCILGEYNDSEWFDKQQQVEIYENLGYFYRLRLAKQRATKEIQPQKFNPTTLSKSTKLAESFRQKKLNKVVEFLSNNPDQEMACKTIRIEDLFLLDQMRKDAELAEKRKLKTQQQLEQCSFRPSLNHKRYVENIPKQRLSWTSRTINSQLKKSCQKVNSGNEKQTSFLKREDEDPKQKKQAKKKITLKSKNYIKDYEKSVIRMSIGRKIRQFQNSYKERGYNNKENWIKSQKQSKKRLKSEEQSLEGYNTYQRCNQQTGMRF